MTQTLPPEYFETMYQADPDPWRFATSEYERAKYAHTLEALGRPHFADAFEIGCSIGVLTRQLVPRCDRLLSVDVSETALASARQLNAATSNATFAAMQVPGDWPQGKFDLILFSEVLYYLSLADISRTAGRTMESLAPGGVVLLVHWTEPTNYPCTGDAAVETFMRCCQPLLAPDRQDRPPQYRLDRLRRR